MQTKHYLTAIHRGLSCAASAVINWFLYLQFFDYNESYKQGKALELIRFIIILIGELIKMIRKHLKKMLLKILLEMI